MVIIGGLVMTQQNATYVTRDFASMSNFPVYDTNTGVWSSRSATGTVSTGPRLLHNAVLGTDDTSIIVCCGLGQKSTDIFNDVLVLDTRTWSWTLPTVAGTFPPPRDDATAVMVNGQMIVLFGEDAEGVVLNDTVILDTRTTPFRWTTTFEPAKNDPLAVVGGVGGIVGIVCGVLVIAAVAIFLLIRKPWVKRHKPNPEISPAPAVANHDPVWFPTP
ncbi:hypothetical protein BC938DRAFT_475200, partial [Jimgerdemannia flammicorona]